MLFKINKTGVIACQYLFIDVLLVKSGKKMSKIRCKAQNESFGSGLKIEKSKQTIHLHVAYIQPLKFGFRDLGNASLNYFTFLLYLAGSLLYQNSWLLQKYQTRVPKFCMSFSSWPRQTTLPLLMLGTKNIQVLKVLEDIN